MFNLVASWEVNAPSEFLGESVDAIGARIGTKSELVEDVCLHFTQLSFFTDCLQVDHLVLLEVP